MSHSFPFVRWFPAAPLVGLLAAAAPAQARNMMSADGPGATYELLQRAYTTETPDCGHMVPHMTEDFDAVLKKNVFIFHAHVAQDDDRCGAQDRQRTEIRGKAADIIAGNGDTIYYRWKFKLPAGFQTSGSFTHIFQIKSDQAAPIMTLTPRNATLSIDGVIGVRGSTELAKFIDTWVVVDLKLHFANAGSVDMKIRRLSDGEMLFSHQGAADMWDDGAGGHDPKWGIYRSLNQRGSLRDEQVRFADFCVSKANATECQDDGAPPPGDGGAGPGTPDADPTPIDAGAGPSDSSGTGGVAGTGGAGGSPAGSGGSVGGGSGGGSGGSPSQPKPDAGSTPRPSPDAAAPANEASSGAGKGCGCALGSSPQPPAGILAGAFLLGLFLRGRRRRR